jgi:hypothetical protein
VKGTILLLIRCCSYAARLNHKSHLLRSVRDSSKMLEAVGAIEEARLRME